MSELRWILVGCGAILLLGIYLWGRRGEQKSAASAAGAYRPRPERQPADAADAAFEDVAEPVGFSAPSLSGEDPVEETVAAADIVETRRPEPPAFRRPADSELATERRGRVEPTLDGEFSAADTTTAIPTEEESLTAELPVNEPVHAPTLSMSSTPPPRRIERRKIIALRLTSSGQRYPGDQLRDAFQAESLQHGKYEVFHRLHDDGGSVFCVASMVEPGTFDLDRMAGQTYTGVTLFAQLPGPIPGVHALQELVTTGKRLQVRLGGTLQDDRGVPLTIHRTDRLRQEVVDFERGQSRENVQRPSPSP